MVCNGFSLCSVHVCTVCVCIQVYTVYVGVCVCVVCTDTCVCVRERGCILVAVGTKSDP